MAESSAQDAGTRLQVLAVAGVVVLVAVLLGVGAFLIAKDGGEDLSQARALGEDAGAAKGAAEGRRRGAMSGLRAGSKAGFRVTYGAAYKRAYRAQFEEAGLEAPGPQEIRVGSP